ncbi:SDR family NAD(P)-dependent oxidoreductase (plasmid) [Polymorphobacter sp. PAMC 29334]|uniref:SDR family NAD(P)-dependent oxidoreductase n=1 Tax=Polymorphobacter sp. PAMC 29334 TaxID=2862331 RepID=UPI001C762D0B|nr:SDR family NAD(P)-dependent oxidoreductase [Polymorphobacter sp. PAMC 29334]QYE33311.1 SDR family NAD(P)-dependent oxidoreductase [Polymorphobacter sp. PAMC 29334]
MFNAPRRQYETRCAAPWDRASAKKEQIAMSLSGRVALVTGGTWEIGIATVSHLAAKGAQLIIPRRRQLELDAAIAEISGAMGIRADAGRLVDVDRLFAAIMARYGQLSVLILTLAAAR